MPDPIFANPRLAQIYDAVDPNRGDLDHYRAMVEEFGAESVLDIGCGTGTLALLLVGSDTDVVAVDPAEASLNVARQKRGAKRVRWVHGDATALPEIQVDMAIMTANVAQAFLTDADWLATLSAIAEATSPHATLIFETRIPARRAWEDWTEARSRRRIEIPQVGPVETWVETTDVSLPFVSFEHTFCFASDGAVVTSESTLRFREHEEVLSSLDETGWDLLETRDAPDRPGKEFVFIATKR